MPGGDVSEDAGGVGGPGGLVLGQERPGVAGRGPDCGVPAVTDAVLVSVLPDEAALGDAAGRPRGEHLAVIDAGAELTDGFALRDGALLGVDGPTELGYGTKQVSSGEFV